MDCIISEYYDCFSRFSVNPLKVDTMANELAVTRIVCMYIFSKVSIIIKSVIRITYSWMESIIVSLVIGFLKNAILALLDCG